MSEKQIPNPYGVSPQTTTEKQGQVTTDIYKNNTLAIVSLVLGILSIMFYFLTAIPGVITGHMARSKIKKMPDRYEGKGMALSGLILSYIMLILSIIIFGGFAYAFLNMPEFKEAFFKGMEEGFQQSK